MKKMDIELENSLLKTIIMEGLGDSKFRFLVLLISMIMCGIQLRLAINKLMDPPTVDSTFSANIKDIDLPLITVCPMSQSIGKALKQLGYETENDLLNGDTSGVTSWGHSNNFTFQEVLLMVYDVNKAKEVSARVSKSARETEKTKLTEEIVFIPRYGFCKEFTNFKGNKEILIYPPINQEQTRVFITDRNFRGHYSLDYSSHKGTPIIVESMSDVMFDVDLEVISKCKISKKPSRESKNDFKKCVDDKIQTVVGTPLGCIPPWMSLNNQCNGTYRKWFTSKVLPPFKDEYVLEVRSLRNMDIEKQCKNYCKTTVSTVSLREEEKKPSGKVKVYIAFNHEAQVHEEVFVYGLFEFVIDVGSTLGLWLGLSAVGLYDVTVQLSKLCRKSMK